METVSAFSSGGQKIDTFHSIDLEIKGSCTLHEHRRKKERECDWLIELQEKIICALEEGCQTFVGEPVSKIPKIQEEQMIQSAEDMERVVAQNPFIILSENGVDLFKQYTEYCKDYYREKSKKLSMKIFASLSSNKIKLIELVETEIVKKKIEIERIEEYAFSVAPRNTSEALDRIYIALDLLSIDMSIESSYLHEIIQECVDYIRADLGYSM